MLLLAWGSAAFLGVLYIAAGIVGRLRLERQRRREDELLTMLAARLAGDETIEVGQALGRSWIGRHPGILQALACGLSGDAARLLHHDAQEAGATDRVRRLAASQSWRARTQGAQLIRLLPSRDPLVRALLTDRRDEVRARALDAVGADILAIHGELVIQACDAEDPAIRFAAQRAVLGGDDRVVDDLTEAIGRAAGGGFSPAGTKAVLAAAAGIPNADLVEAVGSHDWGGDVEQRLQVVAVLASGLGRGSMARLTTMTSDDQAEVRAAALRAIGDLGDASVAAAVGRCLRDQSWDVRQEAGLALTKLGPAGLLILRNHRDDSDRFARDMATEMLRRHSLCMRLAA